jgi:mitotic spindle assembly checkpoint protein MAD1
MEDELLKRIKELEEENSFLKQKLKMQEGSRMPLGSIPIQKQSVLTTVTKQQSYNGLEVDDSLLFYLKSILGYSIKRTSETNLILRSVYAFSSEDIFEIEIKNNKLMLKDTDYLREWSEYFNIYLKNGRSYCAFFAAITLELYNRKTFGK